MTKSKRKSSKRFPATSVTQPSLPDQLIGDTYTREGTRHNEGKRRKTNEHESSGYIDSALSQRILSTASKQHQEELMSDSSHADTDAPLPDEAVSAIELEYDDVDEGEEGVVESEAGNIADLQLFDVPDFESMLAAEDGQSMNKFMFEQKSKRVNLGDIISAQLQKKETELQSVLSDSDNIQVVRNIDPRVVEMYKMIAAIMCKYRSGKVPKAFKVIPCMKNWEQILLLTQPDNWSAAAMFQATRLFVSNMKEKTVQRFFNLILLPRVRDDICYYRKLNPHLYSALRKALFKPGAFMKGILLPLCETGSCTLREAVVLSSLLLKTSIPVLHASAAMLKLAETRVYSGTNSLILRTLLAKKYSLPYRVIDSVHAHFLRFHLDKEQILPVLWHQCLLTFVQHYKRDMSAEQRDLLLELITSQTHHVISPEIRKEINSTIPRAANDVTPNN